MITIDELIMLGVKKLKKFGYSNVSKQNILSDEVYKIFFERILRERLADNYEEQEDISYLLEKINIAPNNSLSH